MSNPVTDLKQELIAAAERQQEQAVAHAGRERRGPLRQKRVLMVAAALPIAAVVALFVSSPWKSSPGFSLDRAQAALTPPEGMILHAAWTVARTSREYGCTITLGPNEVWADLSTPFRYRMIESFWPSPEAVDRRSAACSSNVTTESGGTPYASLRFVAPNRLVPNGPGWIGGSMDDVALLRAALADGRAYDEGQVELDGRVVERIRVDLDPRGRYPLYYYVDRETFIPVQVESPGGAFFDEFGGLRFDFVRRYLTYEYLPRTDENLALTDIREQHPDATAPAGDPTTLPPSTSPPTLPPPTSPPSLFGVDAKTVRVAKGATNAPVTFDVSAADANGVEIPVSCQPESGSRFPLGMTIVRCAATDDSGNTATAELTVTVKR